jgi:serine/threonine protein kinase, bacterial
MAMSCLYLMTARSPKDFGHDLYTGQIDWRSQTNLSPDLSIIFDRLLQQATTMRYHTAAEVIQALESRTPIAPAITNPLQSSEIRSSIQSVSDKAETPVRAGRWHVGGVSGMHGQVTRDQSRSRELKGGRKLIAEYNHGKRNFVSQDYSKASVASATLTSIVLSRARLIETDFCQANLTAANFQGAIMTSAKLNGANLRLAKMQRAILNKADLGGACLDQADLREANLQQAYMSKADLSQ